MKSPQTKIKNEKTPTVRLGSKVPNILVVVLEKAISNPRINGGVAYSIYEKNSQVESKTYSVPELAILCTKINLSLHSSTSVGGAR